MPYLHYMPQWPEGFPRDDTVTVSLATFKEAVAQALYELARKSHCEAYDEPKHGIKGHEIGNLALASARPTRERHSSALARSAMQTPAMRSRTSRSAAYAPTLWRVYE